MGQQIVQRTAALTVEPAQPEAGPPRKLHQRRFSAKKSIDLPRHTAASDQSHNHSGECTLIGTERPLETPLRVFYFFIFFFINFNLFIYFMITSRIRGASEGRQRFVSNMLVTGIPRQQRRPANLPRQRTAQCTRRSRNANRNHVREQTIYSLILLSFFSFFS